MADTNKTQAIVKTHMLEPRATEKTYRESMRRTYVFPVALNATKQEVASLVEKEFNVTVTDVRVLTRKGKKTKFSKGKHAYPGITFRRDHKFAYVTLKDGDSIKVFAEPEEEAKEAKEVKKEDKKSEKTVKSSAKEAKTTEKAVKADKKAAKESK